MRSEEYVIKDRAKRTKKDEYIRRKIIKITISTKRKR
jgi:hypothetical protein